MSIRVKILNRPSRKSGRKLKPGQQHFRGVKGPGGKYALIMIDHRGGDDVYVDSITVQPRKKKGARK